MEPANSVQLYLINHNCTVGFNAATYSKATGSPILLRTILVKDIQDVESISTPELLSQPKITAFMNLLQTKKSENGGNNTLLALWGYYSNRDTFLIEWNKEFIAEIEEILPGSQVAVDAHFHAESHKDDQCSFTRNYNFQFLQSSSDICSWNGKQDLERTGYNLTACPLQEYRLSCCLNVYIKTVLESEPVGSTPWKSSSDAIVQSLYFYENTKDFTIVAMDEKEVKCHGLVLAAQSNKFAEAVYPQEQTEKSENLRLSMPEISEKAVLNLVRYMYGMDTPIPKLSCSIVVELFQTAHKYELVELERELGNFLLAKDFQYFTPDVILVLYQFVLDLKDYSSLKSKLLLNMTKMSGDLRGCAKFKALAKPESDDLLWQLFDLVTLGNNSAKQLTE